MKRFALSALLLTSLGLRAADKPAEPVETTSAEVLEVKPVARFRPDPVYPPELLKDGIAGEALIDFVITENGSVADATVVSASHPRFGEAAQKAVSLAVFTPGRKDGKIVRVRLQVPIRFNPPKPVQTKAK